MDGLGLRKEQGLWASGLRLVAGIDEVGRGALAGPVVAAALILIPDAAELAPALDGVQDSKALSPHQREALFPVICRHAVSIGVGLASAQYIDEHGILAATHRAMLMAVRQLVPRPEYLLIDGLLLPQTEIPQEGIVNGDAQVLSIAAASIIAKVLRDQLMVSLSKYEPGYGFAEHKGYGTPAHMAALERLGPCGLHRRSFAPLTSLS